MTGGPASESNAPPRGPATTIPDSSKYGIDGQVGEYSGNLAQTQRAVLDWSLRAVLMGASRVTRTAAPPPRSSLGNSFGSPGEAHMARGADRRWPSVSRWRPSLQGASYTGGTACANAEDGATCRRLGRRRWCPTAAFALPPGSTAPCYSTRGLVCVAPVFRIPFACLFG